jgi:hypothetical protein
MSIRLFKPRAWLTCAALGALPLVPVACSNSDFVASGAPAGGSGNAAGDEPTAGDAGANDAGSGGAGEGGSSGAGMAGSSAGGAGKPSTTCACKAGEYCLEGTTTCRSCSSFERIHFGEAEELSTLSHAPGTSSRFPRYGGSPSALFYTTSVMFSRQLWFTGSAMSGLGTIVSLPTSSDAAAVLAPGFVVQQNLFFDRADMSGNRKIWMANWDGKLLSDEQLVPAPINVLGADDYSFAVAPNAERVYWMSSRNNEVRLLSHSNASSGGAQPSPLDLKIGNCDAVLGNDATPWVDLNGTVLLFRSQSVNETCALSDSGAYDLFAVGLGKDGKTSTQVVPLASLNKTGGKSTETDPSLTPDLCTVYYASENGGGIYSLYRAQRN